MCVFPFNTVVNVLIPFIQTSPYPMIHGAIKMLTKLVEIHPEEVTDDHLLNIMPGLVKVAFFYKLLLKYILLNFS